MFRLSYWILPILAGVVWLGTLLGLLIYWNVDTHRTHYDSMDNNQNIAYISDVGAHELKPLFIAGCCITSLALVATFGADRWLRHKGRLVPNSTRGEKILSGLTIFFAIIGSLGLILLSIFDTARHPTLHNVFLLFFIAGYILSAIFICWEYQRLGIRNQEHRLLAVSFWIKLAFVVVELLLAVAFVSANFTRNFNVAAVLEWVIAFIFTFYAISFFVDLYPAAFTRDGELPPTFAFRTKGMPRQQRQGALDSRPIAQHSSHSGLDEAAAEEGRAAMAEHHASGPRSGDPVVYHHF